MSTWIADKGTIPAVTTNADLLRAEPDEGLADAIFYTLSEFQSKEALLAYLREEVNTDA